MTLGVDWESKTEPVVAVFVLLEKRWGSSQGAQGNHSLKGRIWGETGELKWKQRKLAAALVEGLGEVEQVEVGAAVGTGQRWSWRLGWSLKDEPRRWQRRMMKRRRWRKQREGCAGFVRMTLNWQKSSHCWSYFLNLSLLKMKRRKRRKSMEAGLWAYIVLYERSSYGQMKGSDHPAGCRKGQHVCGGWLFADILPLHS